jgi:hypothetical protein
MEPHEVVPFSALEGTILAVLFQLFEISLKSVDENPFRVVPIIARRARAWRSGCGQGRTPLSG